MATQPFIANTTSPSNAQASLTFVTGTHALKVGFNDTWGGRHATYDSPAEVGLTYRFNTVNGVTTPNLITEYATPYSNSENLKANLGDLSRRTSGPCTTDAESASASTTSSLLPGASRPRRRSCRTAT